MTSGNEGEQVLTLEALVDFANALHDGRLAAIDDPEREAVDTRQLLNDSGFSRAEMAPEAAVRRTTNRFVDLLPRIDSLPESDTTTATVWVNAELTELSISPWLSDHDGSDLHIHWTPPSATFDDQVLADFLMALAQELGDNGVTRFGRCGADDCERLFYDTSRNGSRRFCSDPRCASRTHTADHRKRKGKGKKSK